MLIFSTGIRWHWALPASQQGMSVAASVPVTETERETFGKARDAVGDKVAEAAEQAKAFAGAVMTEAKQQGLGSGQ